jgi:hypothetical protein
MAKILIFSSARAFAILDKIPVNEKSSGPITFMTDQSFSLLQLFNLKSEEQTTDTSSLVFTTLKKEASYTISGILSSGSKR